MVGESTGKLVSCVVGKTVLDWFIWVVGESTGKLVSCVVGKTVLGW